MVSSRVTVRVASSHGDCAASWGGVVAAVSCTYTWGVAVVSPPIISPVILSSPLWCIHALRVLRVFLRNRPAPVFRWIGVRTRGWGSLVSRALSPIFVPVRSLLVDVSVDFIVVLLCKPVDALEAKLLPGTVSCGSYTADAACLRRAPHNRHPWPLRS